MQVQPFANLFRTIVSRTGRADSVHRVRLQCRGGTTRVWCEFLNGAVVSTTLSGEISYVDGCRDDVTLPGQVLQNSVLVAAALGEPTIELVQYNADEMSVEGLSWEVVVPAPTTGLPDPGYTDEDPWVQLPALWVSAPDVDCTLHIEPSRSRLQWEGVGTRGSLLGTMANHAVPNTCVSIQAAYAALIRSWYGIAASCRLSVTPGWIHLTNDLTLSIPCKLVPPPTPVHDQLQYQCRVDSWSFRLVSGEEGEYTIRVTDGKLVVGKAWPLDVTWIGTRPAEEVSVEVDAARLQEILQPTDGVVELWVGSQHLWVKTNDEIAYTGTLIL